MANNISVYTMASKATRYRYLVQEAAVAINLDIEDRIAVITIDNPPLNVWNTQMSVDLIAIVDSFIERRDIRVAIITGAGDRAFTAGQDLSVAGTGNLSSPMPSPFRQARWYLQALEDCAVPIIGAVNGYALGHGIAICSACDILLASETARFGTPEVRVGLGNGHRMLREIFPKSISRYAYFTGDFITADEAYRVGAVLRVVPPDELMAEARSVAEKIAANSPSSVRMFKDTVRWTESMDLQTGYRFEGERGRLARQDPTYAKNEREARSAFFEKRNPQFDQG
jgi:enoyl-CoA hydratase